MTNVQRQRPAQRNQGHRSLLIQLPIPIADALDLFKVRRQQQEGRLVSKKTLVIEAIEQFLATTP